MEKKIVEHNELIATRVPPGDRWSLVGDPKKEVFKTLTDTLEAFLHQPGFQTGNMRDAKRVKDYDFLLGEQITYNKEKYTIDGTWRVNGTESLYIALKKNGSWMNVQAPEVIKAYINERSLVTS